MLRPNNPPDAPTITGPSQGKRNTQYNFTFTTVDPEQDPVYVYVDWGDNSNSGWVGPKNSGDTFIIAHSWTEKGNFTVKAKAKDDHGAESNWSTFQVKMPYKFSPLANLLRWLFEHFPNAFPILRHLLGY
jgi:hypothetical protein